MTGDMEGRMVWGPEIAVDGKRPYWLRDDDVMQWRFRHSSIWYGADYNTPKGYSAGEWVNTLSFIRLPADHPHYAAQQPRTAPNGGEVGPEVVERMIALVRRVSDSRYGADMHVNDFAEARAIVALLPGPVDGDLIAAREACAAYAETVPDRGLAAEYRTGDLDDQFEVKASLFAIRRALEKEAGR